MGVAVLLGACSGAATDADPAADESADPDEGPSEDGTVGDGDGAPDDDAGDGGQAAGDGSAGMVEATSCEASMEVSGYHAGSYTLTEMPYPSGWGPDGVGFACQGPDVSIQVSTAGLDGPYTADDSMAEGAVLIGFTTGEMVNSMATGSCTITLTTVRDSELAGTVSCQDLHIDPEDAETTAIEVDFRAAV